MSDRHNYKEQSPELTNNFLSEIQTQQEQEIQLQMLTEQCQQLINKLFPSQNNIYNSNIEQPFTASISEDILSNQNQSFQQDKNRLQKQFIDLCVQIQRQQKQLQNYKFKIKVANKQAQYYSRQIKQKEQILQNLEKHQVQNAQRRKSFRK